METGVRKRMTPIGGVVPVVDEVEQDECWKSEGVQILMRELRSTVEDVAWKLPTSAIDRIEVLKSFLRIVIILLTIALYHRYFH